MATASEEMKPTAASRSLPSSAERTAQDRSSYRALQSQIPLLYAVALSNIVGLFVSIDAELGPLAWPTLALVLLMIWRMWHWIKNRNQEPPDSWIASELKMTLIFAIVIAGGFSISAQVLLSLRPEAALPIIFFSSLAAIGCAYALSSHLSAACALLTLLALPLSLRLVASMDTTQIGMGLSLLLISALTYRLLLVQNRDVRNLVSSRLKLQQETDRAQAAEQQAHLLARTDSLTGTANRRALLRALSSAESAGESGVLALIDLDGFKPINDAFGHLTGDAVLKCVSRRLEERFSQEALVTRVGGDEFAIFWSGSDAEKRATDSAADICATLELPMLIDHRPVRLSGCCGVAAGVTSAWTSTDLLIQADMALYAAKAQGRGRLLIFSSDMLEEQQRRSAIEGALASGAVDAELTMVFQPIWGVRTGRIEAYEALARWENSDLGHVEPGEFIPAAEQMGIIGILTDKALELALKGATHWPKDVVLSFNVSARQLCEVGAAERLLSRLHEARFEPQRFQAEVTETALLSDFELARENIAALRSAGALIALDDFGAGNASISYLREMSFDAVKLDGSLVTNIAHSAQSMKLLLGVIALCRSLGVRSVAEHVETQEQLNILRDLGCDHVQGYLLGPPAKVWEASKRQPGNRSRSAA